MNQNKSNTFAQNQGLNLLKNKVLYTFPVNISFVRNDRAMLEKVFRVVPFAFMPARKIAILPLLIRQFFFLIYHVPRTKVLVCWFVGYHSFLPALIGRMFGKQVLLIPGGVDCVNFPSIKYGNFTIPWMRRFTRWSYGLATHLAPVHEWLIENKYSYDTEVPTKQGYKNLYPGATCPATPIYFGYDPNKFFCKEEKIKGSFLTVSQMNSSNFFRKGIDLYIHLAESFPECTFTLVGNSSGMSYPSTPPNLSILPFVPYDELRSVYARHEFYLQVSMCEGFPSAPCEAMLCECIPIVSNVAAMPMIAGDCGFILKKRDKHELLAIVRTALASDRNMLRNNARERIIKQFPLSEREKLIILIEQLSTS